jgi:HlyD family secretion protein
VPLHPVEEVRVRPGDRVKKGQVLVKLDDDEPQADVRAKKAALAELKAGLERLKAQPRAEERAEQRAALEAAQVGAKEARDLLERIKPGFRSGSIPEATYYTARASLLKLEADERAAVARLQQVLKKPWKLEVAEAEAKAAGARAVLESSRAELEHYTVTAPLDGVVSSLDVHPGTVSRPGTTVWGEILDLSEIDVECGLKPEQADTIRIGQQAEVRPDGPPDSAWRGGKVVLVGVAADPGTGRVPVRVRLANTVAGLRCYVPVRVRFPDGGQAGR